MLNTLHVGSVIIWRGFTGVFGWRAGHSFPLQGVERRGVMKIRTHRVSHVVELDDGSQWKIFPGDLDLTLNWKPDTDLCAEHVEGEISSYVLVSRADKTRVRVIPVTENWPVAEVKKILKKG
jgi:hypothetical protein